MIRLAQVEEELSTALSKNSSLEKSKARLTGEVEDLQLDLERVSTSASVSSLFLFIQLSFCRETPWLNSLLYSFRYLSIYSPLISFFLFSVFYSEFVLLQAKMKSDVDRIYSVFLEAYNNTRMDELIQS